MPRFAGFPSSRARLGLVCLLVWASCALTGVAFGQVREAYDSERLAPSDVGATVSDVDLAALAKGIVQRTNAFRKGEGQKETRVNRRLQESAEGFARFMAEHDKYGHTADGRRPAERVAASGYEFCIVSENIAYRFTASRVSAGGLADGFFTGWKKSQAHRANILDPDVMETGVGVAQSEKSGYFYAVQVFGRPKSASIEFTLENKSRAPLAYRIGEQAFELPARYARTHLQCRPPKVEFLAPDDPEKTARTLEPKGGERFAIQPADGGLRVTAQ